MEIKIKDIERIENYLEGNLPENEMELLKDDQDFQKQVEIHKDLHKAIVIQGEKKLKTELNGYYNDYKEQKPSGKNKVVFLRLIAAAAILLVVVTLGIKLGSQKSNNNIGGQMMLEGGKSEAPNYATKKVYSALTLDSYDFKNDVLKLYGRNFNSEFLNLYKIKNKVYIESGSEVFVLNENTLEVENADINLDSYKVLFPASEENVTVICIKDREIVQTLSKSVKVYK